MIEKLRPMVEQTGGNKSFPSDSRVVDVAFHPGGKKAASVSETSTIKIWDLNFGECLQSFRVNDFGMVSSITFNPDGNKIITGHYSSLHGSSPSLHLWDTELKRVSMILEVLILR